MFLLCFLTVTTVLWQEDFTHEMPTLDQLYDYTIDIDYRDGVVFLSGEPQFNDFTAAWFYVDENIAFRDTDVLELVMKIKSNNVRLRYFYRHEDRAVYFCGERIIQVDNQWQKVEIPFSDAQPFYGSDYPLSLTPGTKPCLYLFISNELPGTFDMEIDWIAISRSSLKREER